MNSYDKGSTHTKINIRSSPTEQSGGKWNVEITRIDIVEKKSSHVNLALCLLSFLVVDDHEQADVDVRFLDFVRSKNTGGHSSLDRGFFFFLNSQGVCVVLERFFDFFSSLCFCRFFFIGCWVTSTLVRQTLTGVGWRYCSAYHFNSYFVQEVVDFI